MVLRQTIKANGHKFTVAQPTKGHHYASTYFFGLLLHSQEPAPSQDEAIADVIAQMDGLERMFLPNKEVYQA